MACNRELLSGYLTNQLTLEDQLDFLTHVDSCTHCWDEVYNATKSKHPHYYKSNARQVKVSQKELKELGDDETFREEIFEVA